MSKPRDLLRFPPPRRRSIAGLAVRWVTLLSFTAGSVGVPLNPLALWGATGSCAKRPGEPCRCSALSQSLGTCCCARGASEKAQVTAASASKPCCSTGDSSKCKMPLAGARGCEKCPTPVKSCCAKQKPVAEPPVRTSSLAMPSCPCGGASPTALLLVCGEPRVRPAAPELTVLVPTMSVLERFDLSAWGVRPQPDVPPPKSLPA